MNPHQRLPFPFPGLLPGPAGTTYNPPRLHPFPEAAAMARQLQPVSPHNRYIYMTEAELKHLVEVCIEAYTSAPTPAPAPAPAPTPAREPSPIPVPSPSPSPTPPKVDDENLACDFCGLSYPDRESVERHILRSHSLALERRRQQGAPLPLRALCEVCGARYYSKYSLRSHLRSAHNIRLNIGEFGGPKNLQCPQCSKCFDDYKLLRAHQRRHGARRYTCDICGRAYTESYELRRHLLKGHQEA